MQTTRRWKRSEQQSCDRLAEVSSDHAVCGLTGLWCPRLQTAHFTGCPQQCRAHYKHSDEAEQQPGSSFKLNFIISGLRILILEQHTALLWAPFQQASPRSFSSSWQYIQQSTAAQDTCAGTKPFQLKATYVSEPTPAHEVADRIFSLQVPPALTDLYHFHPNTQGHSVEVPLWCQTVFLHHREVVVTLE